MVSDQEAACLSTEIVTSFKQKKIENPFAPRVPAARRPLPRMLEPQKNIYPSLSPREPSRTPSHSSEEEPETSESEYGGSLEDVRCSVARERSPRLSPSPRPSRRSKNASLDPKDFNSSDYSQKTPRKADRIHQKSSRSSKTNSGHKNIFFCIFCFTVFAIFAVIIGSQYSNALNVTISDEIGNERKLLQETLINLGKNIDGIKEKFKQQYPDIWNDLEAGIAEVILDPRRPTTFLFFSNEDHPMFCLAKMIGDASKNALGTDNNLFLSPVDLGSDYGTVIHKFRDSIRQQKVVIVENLLDIHPEAMKAFHNLCDRENPAVPEAIYILTMITDSYKNESYIEFVEEQLTRKLIGKVGNDKLQPLITRITDAAAIIHVQPEPSFNSCPLRY